MPTRGDGVSQSVWSPIPFNKPWILGKELEYVAEAIRTGAIAGDGPFTRRCAGCWRSGSGSRRS